MLGRFRSALYNAIGNLEEEGGVAPPRQGSPTSQTTIRQKYNYQRPAFLKLETEDEIQVTADHNVRPIIVPRDVSALPWNAGYAETINAGKSVRNEDQAFVRRGCVSFATSQNSEQVKIPYTMFGMFDGHAGSGCAVTASNDLWKVIQSRLESVGPHLVESGGVECDGIRNPMWFPTRSISTESLVIGAIESAFWEMDARIGEEKKVYRMLGGCTVLLAVFILGKLYVANAGDSRGVLCRRARAYPMSSDFTPVSERQRLQQLGRLQPHLLGDEYTWLEYIRKPVRRDIGSRMLYRDAHMTGWAYKMIEENDLKFPLVYGEGKRSRLLATIGVTRGFGDHDLRAQSSTGTVYIKPFLSPQPEVRVLDVENEEVTGDDVLVLATDGLWDVVSNEEVASIVQRGLATWDNESKAGRYRYISLAQDLVMSARGKLRDRNWRRSDNLAATIDDISVLVIPILPYKEEYNIEKEGAVQHMENGLDAMDVETSAASKENEKEATCDNKEIPIEDKTEHGCHVEDAITSHGDDDGDLTETPHNPMQ
jgi:protein phosphatase 1H